jgi:outer membrane protein TolC
MNAEVEALQATAAVLEQSIKDEQEAVDILRERVRCGQGGAVSLLNHTISLEELAAKVRPLGDWSGLVEV